MALGAAIACFGWVAAPRPYARWGAGAYFVAQRSLSITIAGALFLLLGALLLSLGT